MVKINMVFEKYCPSLNMSLRWNTASISRVVRELQRSTKMRGKRSVARGLTLTSVLDPVPPHVSQPFLARQGRRWDVLQVTTVIATNLLHVFRLKSLTEV